MATVKKAPTNTHKARTKRKLGRHKKYRGKGFKAYKGQGK
jgi:hypothetical protein